MAQIGTGADALVSVFNGTQNIDHLVVAMAWSVVVNGHANVEFLDEFFETGKGFGGRIGREDWNPCRFGKLKYPAIGSGILAKPIHAMRADRQP